MNFDFMLGDWGPTGRHRSPNSPPPDGNRVLEYGKPDLVLISRGQPQSTHVMQMNRKTWVMLYQDRHAQVWGRSTKYDDPNSSLYIPPAQRSITDEPQIGTTTWPALPVWGRKTNRLATDSGNQSEQEKQNNES